MAEGALAFDHDHRRRFAAEGMHNRGLHLAGAVLGGDGIEGDAVAAALDQAGLAGAHEHGVDAGAVERLHEQGGGGAFADGAIGAEHGDTQAIGAIDRAIKQAQILEGGWPPHIADRHLVL